MKELDARTLAMYLGCRMQTFALGDKNNFGVFTEISLDARPEQSFVGVICDGDVHQRIFRLFEVKPILRRLTYIDIEDAAHVLQQTYFPHVGYPMSDYRLEVNQYGNPRISIDNDWFTHELTFGKNAGSIWASDKLPSWNTKIAASSFAFLLSRGYDLFNLIDSGLAIEKEPVQGE